MVEADVGAFHVLVIGQVVKEAFQADPVFSGKAGQTGEPSRVRVQPPKKTNVRNTSRTITETGRWIRVEVLPDGVVLGGSGVAGAGWAAGTGMGGFNRVGRAVPMARRRSSMRPRASRS